MTNRNAIRNATHDGQITHIEDLGALTLVVRDQYVTTSIEVWAGTTIISAYQAHTRHPDTAAEAGRALISDVTALIFRDALNMAAKDHTLTPFDPTATDPTEGDQEMPWARR